MLHFAPAMSLSPRSYSDSSKCSASLRTARSAVTFCGLRRSFDSGGFSGPVARPPPGCVDQRPRPLDSMRLEVFQKHSIGRQVTVHAGIGGLSQVAATNQPVETVQNPQDKMTERARKVFMGIPLGARRCRDKHHLLKGLPFPTLSLVALPRITLWLIPPIRPDLSIGSAACQEPCGVRRGSCGPRCDRSTQLGSATAAFSSNRVWRCR
jgi:hypothetical protein